MAELEQNEALIEFIEDNIIACVSNFMGAKEHTEFLSIQANLKAWTTMLQGLKGAEATFEEVMKEIPQGMA